MVTSIMAKPTPAHPPIEDDNVFVDAVQDGLRSLDAGRSLSYEKVRRWLLSWRTEELPPEYP